MADPQRGNTDQTAHATGCIPSLLFSPPGGKGCAFVSMKVVPIRKRKKRHQKTKKLLTAVIDKTTRHDTLTREEFMRLRYGDNNDK